MVSEDTKFILFIKIIFLSFADMAKEIKPKHGLKGKPSNNPNGRGETGIKKEQVGIYIPSDAVLKLGGKKAIRMHFTQLVDKLLKK